jgi:hypothetical protein
VDERIWRMWTPGSNGWCCEEKSSWWEGSPSAATVPSWRRCAGRDGASLGPNLDDLMQIARRELTRRLTEAEVPAVRALPLPELIEDPGQQGPVWT